MAGVIVIVQRRMRRVSVLGDGKVLPLPDVLVGDVCVVRGVGFVVSQIGDDGHGLDTDHAL